MDYVDYNPVVKKTWETEQQGHLKRVKAISKMKNKRIDNQLNCFYFKAPCRDNKKNQRTFDYVKKAHLNRIKEIRDRFNKKKPIEKIEAVCTYSTFSSKFRSARSIESKPNTALSKVSGDISFEKFEKDFLRSLSYKKRIAKPHLEKRNMSRSKGKVNGKLLEVPLCNLVKLDLNSYST